MKRVIYCLLFLTVIHNLVIGQKSDLLISSEGTDRNELIQLRRTFFDAQKHGDRSTLEKLIADSFYFVHSTGVLTKKKEFIDRTVTQAGLQPLIEFLDEELFIYGDHTAVWLTRSVSRNSDGIETNFRATDVLVKKDNRWQWVSVHSTKLSTRPKPVSVSADTLKGYIGQYQINENKIFIVSEEKGNLIGHLAGLRQKELIPKTANEFVWFSPETNVELRISFLRNEKGQITYAVLYNESLEVWRAKKVK